jgi:phospholipid/cholesterol/gamma-HCH transport system substrate-binding protein
LGTDSASTEESRGSRLARWLTAGALLGAVILVAVVFFNSSGGGHKYQLLFENAGQLVPGNQVLVAGQPVGSVDDVGLTDDSQAEIKITTDDPLREGTTAVIRATSLSGVANRYVSLTLGPNDAPAIADDSDITGAKTTSPVDLDQLFDTFDTPTRRALQKVIQGQASVYAGHTKGANQTYKYFAPALSSTQRLLDELTRDQRSFTDFLVSSSKVLTAVAERRNELSSLVSNANTSLGAIAKENTSLDRSLVALPPALRQANTTFVNLRAVLDDLDPLVAAAKPATKNLPLFLRRLRPVAVGAIPVVGNLAAALSLPGPNNDLTDALAKVPGLQRRAATASPNTVDALNASQPEVTFARPYTPDLMAFVGKFGQATAYYDADGHYARVEPADTGFFAYNAGTQQLDPIPESAQYTGIDTGVFTRCPGGATQPVLGSNPFLDDGALAGKCSPADVPPGP